MEEGLRPDVGAPPETTVTTAKLDRHAELCPHGLRWFRVDGEAWHLDVARSVPDRPEVYVACDQQLQLGLGAKKAKR